MRMKKLMLLICSILMFPPVALAEVNADLRVKLGTSEGVDELNIEGVPSPGSSTGAGNFQVEVDISPRQASPVGYVFSAGLFGRTHSGDFIVIGQPARVDYRAGGLSLGAGAGVKASDRLHFEGKLELGLGSGELDLSTPGVIQRPRERGSYSSVSLIFGGYFTISQPGLQVGLELGSRSFRGDFKIWNDAGFWNHGNVKGNGGIVNLVVGYRF